MKITITGGAGFIGTRLSELLFNQGHELICIDTFTETIHGNDSDNIAKFYSSIETVSYGNIDYYEDIYASSDVIFLLAAETGMGASQYNNSLYCNTNILETSRILDFLRKIESTAHLILPSSCRIYGEGTYICEEHGKFVPKGRDIADLKSGLWEVKCPQCSQVSTFKSNLCDQPVSATSTYAITKYAQEALVLTNAKTASYDATILRLQNVYGPGQSFNNAYTGLVSIFSQQILNNRSLELYEGGAPTRDFVYVDDVCDALLRVMNNRSASKGKVYDIGSGVQTSVHNIAEKLVHISGIDVPILSSPRFRFGDILNGCADLKNIKNDLDWVPNFSIDDGLQNYWIWLLSQGTIIDHSCSSDEELVRNKILIDPEISK